MGQGYRKRRASAILQGKRYAMILQDTQKEEGPWERLPEENARAYKYSLGLLSARPDAFPRTSEPVVPKNAPSNEVLQPEVWVGAAGRGIW